MAEFNVKVNIDGNNITVDPANQLQEMVAAYKKSDAPATIGGSRRSRRTKSKSNKSKRRRTTRRRKH